MTACANAWPVFPGFGIGGECMNTDHIAQLRDQCHVAATLLLRSQ